MKKFNREALVKENPAMRDSLFWSKLLKKRILRQLHKVKIVGLVQK